jgi:ribose-phosphate pyrophosphokinase
MVLTLLIDAARAAGAARVTAVVPYFGYARQEQRSRPGDPRSARVAAQLLGSVGLDHLITVDLHAPALESAFSMSVTNLNADELFLPRIKAWGVVDLVIVAPDAGGLKRAQRFALALETPLTAIAKQRPRHDVVTALQVLGDVKNKTCVIVDDMASTGRTLAGAAESLRKCGARDIHAVFTHAVMSSDAKERLGAARLGKVLTSDSIPVKTESWLEVVSVASLLARAVESSGGLVLAKSGRP